MSSYFKATPSLTGNGKIAAKTREFEKAFRRIRPNAYGLTTGPLGTWTAYQRRVRTSGGGSDTWAA